MQKSLDVILKKLCDSDEYVGLSLLVSQNKEIKYFSQEGWANKEKGERLLPDSIFHLYSLSKPITSAAIMHLCEIGKLDIMDKVSKYLPAYEHQMVRENGKLIPARRNIIIKDLLNMTSGISYPGETDTPELNALYEEAMEKAMSRHALDTMTLVNRLAQIPLNCHPGSRWQYGASADILGAVAEVVTGKAFGDFLKQLFFEPLEMQDTDFFVPKEKRNRLAVLYKFDKDNNYDLYKGRNLVVMDYEKSPAFQSGGAGLFSTAGDYHKFTSMLCQDGEYKGRRYLNEKTVKYMGKNQLTKEQKKYLDWEWLKGYGYGNLMRVSENPKAAGRLAEPGEFGWDGWAGSYMEIHPKYKIEIILMTSQIDKDNYNNRRKICNMIYQSLINS